MQRGEGFDSFPKGYKKGPRYIIITGSVMSGVGKGTFSAALGTLLKFHGFNVQPIKFDGYLNYDAGTLNPYRHGEVFVLNDRTECDLDLGSYERMLDMDLDWHNYLTAGKIFKHIIDKERSGGYLGRDVQFIPHVTGEINHYIRELALKKEADIVLVEVGGTVGDLENSYFLEAMRQLAHEEEGNVMFINLCYIMEPKSLGGEQKSKSAQLGIRMLQSLGIQPHIIVCRSESPVFHSVREKISISSSVPVERVIDLYDTENMYAIPLHLMEIGIDKEILGILNLNNSAFNNEMLDKWKKFVEMVKNSKDVLKIAMTGKYTEVHDSYMSILKALEHTAPYFGCKVNIKWLETTNITTYSQAVDALKDVHGIIVPGGFGGRGMEGKILCARVAREKKVPYLGICLGLQIAVIEFARDVLKLEGVCSTELDPNTNHPVIDLLPHQKELLAKGDYGATMRLGSHDVVLKEGSFVHSLYQKDNIKERFRHRFEVNPQYREQMEKAGFVFSGTTPDNTIALIGELKGHPFFVGTQYHPEFTSKPLSPSPIFRGFLEACKKRDR